MKPRTAFAAALMFVMTTTAFADGVTMVDPNTLSFSQKTAGGSAPGEPPRTPEYRKLMKQKGFFGEPLKVVRVNGVPVSLDNTRLALAQELGVKQVPVVEVSPNTPLTPAEQARFENNWKSAKRNNPKMDIPRPRTWGDAMRVRTLANKLPAEGTTTRPHLAGDPKATRPSRLPTNANANRTFQALDALAEAGSSETRATPTTGGGETQAKKSGGAGRIRQDLLGEKAPQGNYTRPVAQAPGTKPNPQGKPQNLTGSRFTRPGPMNSFLETPLSKNELRNLYQEALTQRNTAGPVKLGNGQTWFVDPATGNFRPMNGPGVVQLTGQEVKHLNNFTNALRNGTDPIDALRALSRDMGKAGSQLTPEMARALKTIGQANDILPEEIASALENRMPKISEVRRAHGDLIREGKDLARGRPFKILKYGGRTLLAIGIAVDTYEIYVAENKAKVATEKAGAWGGALGASAATAKVAAPLLAAGPLGWVAYGTAVVGSGVIGYMLGEKLGETVYDSVAEEPKNGGGGW